jgi:hypothetical protein
MDTERRLREMQKECAESCDGDEMRCICGNLIARATPDGIELKCRRCKRVFIIPIDVIEK